MPKKFPVAAIDLNGDARTDFAAFMTYQGGVTKDPVTPSLAEQRVWKTRAAYIEKHGYAAYAALSVWDTLTTVSHAVLGQRQTA